ncbi:hypothetical protein WSM22_30370 [Cytophagales bacterium WSM2-2]|nr:hypothetical protein WSM22_30370 [Cytophagales bacterium WSM2-2]
MLAQKRGQDKVDSLLTALAQSKADSSRLKVMLSLMTVYNDFNGEEGLKYEKPAIALAEKLKSKTAIADVKNATGRIYWRKGDIEQGLRYHTEARKIFESANDRKKIALTIRYIGQDYADGGNYPEALKYFSIALEMYTRMGDRRNMAYMHNFLSWVYHHQGNHLEASKSNYSALQLFEETGDEQAIATTLADIAADYIYLGNREEALSYFLKSIETYKSYGDMHNVAYTYNTLGSTYRLMGNFAEAQKCHSLALSQGMEMNNPNIMADAYDGLADVSIDQHDYRRALSDYLASVELLKKWSNKKDMARVYCKVGACYMYLKKYENARDYFDKTLALLKDLKSKSLIIDYYRGVERLDSAMGKWQSAYINHKKYISSRDSIINQESTSEMVQLQLNHEFDRREAAVKAEQNERDLRQQIQFFSLVTVVVFISILAIVMYRNQKRENLINRELKLKSDSLEEENREKTGILNIVSHDLKAPFNKIRGLTDIMMMTEDLSREEKEQYISHIRNSIDQGNYLTGILLESQSAHESAKEAAFETIDLEKFITGFQQSVSGQLLKKGQKLVADLHLDDKRTYTDPQMLTRILDNLVSNASKFSEAGAFIYLKVWCEEKSTNFSIRDEGPGISEEDQKKMFRKFQLLTARPTGGEGSAGLGLSIAKVLIEKMNGTIEVNSTLGEGTEFVVMFFPPL